MTDRDATRSASGAEVDDERIASNLLELEGDATVAMLDASDLRGLTAARWSDTRVRLAGLFAAHTALKELMRPGGGPAAEQSWFSRRSHSDQLDRPAARPFGGRVRSERRGPADRGLLAVSRRVVTSRTPTSLIDDMASCSTPFVGRGAASARVWDVGFRASDERDAPAGARAVDCVLPASTHGARLRPTGRRAAEACCSALWTPRLSRSIALEADVAAFERDNAAAGELTLTVRPGHHDGRSAAPTPDDFIARSSAPRPTPVARAEACRTRRVALADRNRLPIDDLAADPGAASPTPPRRPVVRGRCPGRWPGGSAAGERRSCVERADAAARPRCTV